MTWPGQLAESAKAPSGGASSFPPAVSRLPPRAQALEQPRGRSPSGFSANLSVGCALALSQLAHHAAECDPSGSHSAA